MINRSGAQVVVLGLVAFSSRLHAQLCSQWDVTLGQPGVDGIVYTLASYQGDLIAGGAFVNAGGTEVRSIARWNGSQWLPFEQNGYVGVGIKGAPGDVGALVEFNGDLIVGGYFGFVGGGDFHSIARWDGAWHPFVQGDFVGVGGQYPYVTALAVYNGELIVGGGFWGAGEQLAHHIVRWNGVTWLPFIDDDENGVGPVSPNGFTAVYALAVYKGDLIVGGRFITAGGETVSNIARWDGATWHQLSSNGQIGVNEPVHALALDSNGDLIVGGAFDTAGGITVNYIARWDGSSWHALESGGQAGTNGLVSALALFEGDIFVGGSFNSAGGQSAPGIARWDGQSWHALDEEGLGGSPLGVDALMEFGGNLVVGGILATAAGKPASNIVEWLAEPLRVADITCNGVVDVDDLLAIINSWGPCPAPPQACPADIAPTPDGNGTVDVDDLLLVINNWG